MGKYKNHRRIIEQSWDILEQQKRIIRKALAIKKSNDLCKRSGRIMTFVWSAYRGAQSGPPDTRPGAQGSPRDRYLVMVMSMDEERSSTWPTDVLWGRIWVTSGFLWGRILRNVGQTKGKGACRRASWFLSNWKVIQALDDIRYWANASHAVKYRISHSVCARVVVVCFSVVDSL